MTEKEAIACELLVLRCRRGHREALEDLVQTWERPLFYYIRRLIDNEDEARHVLQQTWLKIFQGLKRLREPRKLPAWLYTIARRTAMSHLRARYSEIALFRSDERLPECGDGDAHLSFDNAERIHYGLDRLSLAHREVLTLFFLQDLTIEDIASVLEIPAGTVKSRLHHAKRMLRAILEAEESGYE